MPPDAARRSSPSQTSVSASFRVSQDLPESNLAFPQIAGYEILSILGRGGMGVVYKARHIKLRRFVALKMILAGEHADAGQLDRFRTEAEAVARLQHPNIVQIHEIGEHDGLPFFSLEFCPGGSLDKKLKSNPLSLTEAAKLVETLARAMDAAHKRQIIHRDLKPANVLLGVADVPKITDFGLAKKLDDVGHTQTGAVMGTPSYMAPEQAGGETKNVGPPADIYALGAILYELLTGRPPFRAANSLKTLMLVISEEPVPPRKLQPTVPRDLETICLRCLRKKADKRYATAKDLADDLRRFQADEPIVARPVGHFERSYRWCRRNVGVTGLIFSLLLLIGVTAAVLLAFNTQRDAQTSVDKAKKSLKKDEEPDVAPIAPKNAQREVQTDADHAKNALKKQVEPVVVGAVAQKGGARIVWQQSHGGGPRTNVSGVTFSPDGKKVVSGCDDHTLKVWNAWSGQETLTLKGTPIP